MGETINSLRQVFRLNQDEMSRLIRHCNISPRLLNDPLTQVEIDRIYDYWLSIDEEESTPSACPDTLLNAQLDLITEEAYKQIIATNEGHPTPRSVKSKGKNCVDNTGGRQRKRIMLIDTCSLLTVPSSQIFLRNIAPELRRTGNQLIVPLVVVNEIKRHANKHDNTKLCNNAKTMLQTITDYQAQGIIGIYGDEKDGTFADNLFHQIVAMFALRYDVVIITQDRNLGQDLLAMGHMKSVGNRKISVRKLDKNNGHLLNVQWKGGL